LKKRLLNISTLVLIRTVISTQAFATNLPIRGIARGEPGTKVGDKAHLTTPALKKAHEEGKVIALMLGRPAHCPWCDKMDRFIYTIMKETNNFDNRAVFIQVQTEIFKMVHPGPEGRKLKKAYGVKGQPWLYIIDKEGIVRYLYKIFTSRDVFKKNMLELIKEAEDKKE